MSKIPFTSPKFKLSAFNCPYCSAYSDQRWFTTITPQGDFLEETHVCFCSHCNKYSIWFKGSMIYPDFSGIEPPNADLNKDIVSDYNEAVSILQRSPRGSAALLRLAIQKLCVQLGENGKNLNTDIAKSKCSDFLGKKNPGIFYKTLKLFSTRCGLIDKRK